MPVGASAANAKARHKRKRRPGGSPVITAKQAKANARDLDAATERIRFLEQQLAATELAMADQPRLATADQPRLRDGRGRGQPLPRIPRFMTSHPDAPSSPRRTYAARTSAPSPAAERPGPASANPAAPTSLVATITHLAYIHHLFVAARGKLRQWLAAVSGNGQPDAGGVESIRNAVKKAKRAHEHRLKDKILPRLARLNATLRPSDVRDQFGLPTFDGQGACVCARARALVSAHEHMCQCTGVDAFP